VCIGRDAPFVRSIRSHKIQTGTGQELLRLSVELVPIKRPWRHQRRAEVPVKRGFQ
jgi:hypothetical protein